MALTDEDKKWLGELLENRLNAWESRFDRKIANLEERLEATETRLLTAFHRWASPTEQRITSHTLMLSAVEERLQALDDRVKKLEGR